MAYGQTPDSNPVRFFILRSDVHVDVCQATMGQDPQSSHNCYKVFIPGAFEDLRKPVVIITCLQIEPISAYRFVEIALHSNSVL
jgi:hypothetical protein